MMTIFIIASRCTASPCRRLETLGATPQRDDENTARTTLSIWPWAAAANNINADVAHLFRRYGDERKRLLLLENPMAAGQPEASPEVGAAARNWVGILWKMLGTTKKQVTTHIAHRPTIRAG
jgi:hypothetical protein